jgi:hypothetical protein
MKLIPIVFFIVLNTQLLFAKLHLQQDIKPENYYIGSIIKYSINLVSDTTGYFLQFPNEKLSTEQYDMSLNTTTNNSAIYNIQCWETGEIWLPSLTVIVSDLQNTETAIVLDSIKVLIKSSLDKSTNELKSIKQNKTIEIDVWKRYFFYSLSVLAILILIYLQYNKTNSNPFKRGQTSSSYSNTFESLYTEINNLKINQPVNNINAEKYYLAITTIFKKFLKIQFFINSTEMTTIELVDFLKSVKNVNTELLLELVALLERADSIKFAKQLPTLNDVENDKLFLQKVLTQLKVLKTEINELD